MPSGCRNDFRQGAPVLKETVLGKEWPNHRKLFPLHHFNFVILPLIFLFVFDVGKQCPRRHVSYGAFRCLEQISSWGTPTLIGVANSWVKL